MSFLTAASERSSNGSGASGVSADSFSGASSFSFSFVALVLLAIHLSWGRPSWDIDHHSTPTLCGETAHLTCYSWPTDRDLRSSSAEGCRLESLLFCETDISCSPAGATSGSFYVGSTMSVTGPLHLRLPPNWCA